jgi:glycosyltransferase involved in cell wall biosynthesis
MGEFVTVLIPSYNSGRYLKKAIKSVFAQTYSDWKIMLINDASTDDSMASVKHLLTDPKIRLINNRINIGQAKSLNVGLSCVDTKFTVQLDGDDLFLPNTLEILMKSAVHQPSDVAVIYGNFKTVYEDQMGKCLKTLIQRGPKFKDRYDFILKNRTLRPRLYRTECLRKIGGWPTNGPFEDRYVEDRRILMRLLDTYRFYWIDELMYVYRKHSDNQTHDRKHCEIMKEWIVRDALKRWNNEYEPEFVTDKYGWRRVARLIPKSGS